MEKILGLLYIIIGLLLVIYPIFSSAFISLVIGFSLIFFGISAICSGIVFSDIPGYRYMSIIIGLISLILGILFIFFLNAISFIVSFQFYIIGFLMIFYGLLGLAYLKGQKYKAISIMSFIFGIITIALAVLAASQPYILAIIIGALLIIHGIILLVIGGTESLIEKYE